MALLGGCRLPTDVTRHHLTFTILPGIGQAPAIGKRSEQTGLLSKDDFARIAEQWLNRTDGDYRISLLGVGGLDKVREAAGEEMSSGFMKALGRHIQARSVDGDAAGELAAGRFGLIHRGELDERLLQQKISDLAATIDLQDRIVVAKHTLELSAPDLTAADAAGAGALPACANVVVVGRTRARAKPAANTDRIPHLRLKPRVSLRSRGHFQHEELFAVFCGKFPRNRLLAGCPARVAGHPAWQGVCL